MNTMKMQKLTRILMALGAVLPLSGAAQAITASELAELQREGGQVRLIDVRPSARFKLGSIPGAMSVPAAVLLEKNFAPLGRVVLFSDGLGDIDMARYVEALNQRAGVQAEALEGGFAAWLDERRVTTAASGLARATPPMISYQRLEALTGPVVMVDLRKAGGTLRLKSGQDDGGRLARENEARRNAMKDKRRSTEGAGGNTGTQAAVAGLEGVSAEVESGGGEAVLDVLKRFCENGNREFCNDPVELRRRYARAGVARVQGAGLATHEPRPLIVLVDNDGESAREECRRMKISGYNRVVILAGGELALQTKGKPGLGRVGGRIFRGGLDGLNRQTDK